MGTDRIVAAPANPAQANTNVTWFDTGDGGYENFAGVVGEIIVDQPVTLFVETAPAGGTLRVVNNAGAGETIAANTPTEVRVVFTGGRTKLRVRTGGTPPSDVWHFNARVTEREIA